MSCDQKGCRVLLQTTSLLAGLLCLTAPALAQEIATPRAENWRPKNGIYAAAGADFNTRCRDFGDLTVQVGKKSIHGHEWHCKIAKLADTAQDAIRLDMTCVDYNLADFIGDPNPERKFKEVMLLKKVSETTIFVRKTINGKFKDPNWTASYCPDEAQRLYTEAKAREEAEAEQRAAEEKARPTQQSAKSAAEATAHNKAEAARRAREEDATLNPWRPQDGIYATPGPNFENRCLQASDAAVELGERSVSSGTDKCSVTFIRDEPDAIRLFATCSRQPNAQGATGAVTSQISETIILKKADDKTIHMQKSVNGDFIGSGRQLSYCSQDAQKKYVEKNRNK